MIVRTALLALMLVALDLGWLLAPAPGTAVTWPRTATFGHCALTLHEPRRDPASDDQGAHTLRLAFACAVRASDAHAPGGTAQAALRGTAVVTGQPQADRGAYAMDAARVGAIAFPTVLEPESADARECLAAVEAALSGTALADGDPRFRALPRSETLLAGPDARVYALRGGAWWREETDGSWSRLAERGSSAARRDARLAPLERAMTERQLREGR